MFKRILLAYFFAFLFLFGYNQSGLNSNKIFLHAKTGIQPFLYSSGSEILSKSCIGCIYAANSINQGVVFAIAPGYSTPDWIFSLDLGVRISDYSNGFLIKKISAPGGNSFEELYDGNQFKKKVLNTNNYDFQFDRTGYSLQNRFNAGRRFKRLSIGVFGGLLFTKLVINRPMGVPYMGIFYSSAAGYFNSGNQLIVIEGSFNSASLSNKNNRLKYNSQSGMLGIWYQLDLTKEGKVFFENSFFWEGSISEKQGEYTFRYYNINGADLGGLSTQESLIRWGIQFGLSFKLR